MNMWDKNVMYENNKIHKLLRICYAESLYCNLKKKLCLKDSKWCLNLSIVWLLNHYNHAIANA